MPDTVNIPAKMRETVLFAQLDQAMNTLSFRRGPFVVGGGKPGHALGLVRVKGVRRRQHPPEVRQPAGA